MLQVFGQMPRIVAFASLQNVLPNVLADGRVLPVLFDGMLMLFFGDCCSTALFSF